MITYNPFKIEQNITNATFLFQTWRWIMWKMKKINKLIYYIIRSFVSHLMSKYFSQSTILKHPGLQALLGFVAVDLYGLVFVLFPLKIHRKHILLAFTKFKPFQRNCLHITFVAGVVERPDIQLKKGFGRYFLLVSKKVIV